MTKPKADGQLPARYRRRSLTEIGVVSVLSPFFVHSDRKLPRVRLAIATKDSIGSEAGQ